MDCHMMVSDPEKVLFYSFLQPFPDAPQWVDAVAEAGGSLYCFHYEATSRLVVFPHSKYSDLRIEDPMALIKQIHDKGMKAGIAISPDTPSTVIADEVGNAVDMILVMTVHPGLCSLSPTGRP